MEKERTESIIDRLILSIENGQNVPLAAGKVMVNRDETVLLLKELRSIMKNELKMYREVTDKRAKFINDARKEAESIVKEAEAKASRIRVTKRMSSMDSSAYGDTLEPDEREALRTAGDIYAASLIYTDEMLTEVSDVVARAYDIVQSQYSHVLATLEEKSRVIANNKADLMNSLYALSNEERYAQILELSQLLSNELYNERMKAMQPELAENMSEEAAGEMTEAEYESGYGSEHESEYEPDYDSESGQEHKLT